MPKVSIIIPVYNAEKYIETTIKSVLAQTISNWELLLIDDSSDDSTPIICNKFVKADSRIIYVRQIENGGPSKARNLGLDSAQGEFIAFVDSDDTLEPTFLNKMLTAAIEGNSDIVWCNYKEIVEGNVIYKNHNLPCRSPIPYEFYIRLFFANIEGLGSLWNKLYRRCFLEQNNMRLNTERVHGEDWEFNMSCFKCHPVVIAIEDSLYNYIRQSKTSIISSYRSLDYSTFVKSNKMLEELALNEGIEYDKQSMKSNFIYLVIQLLVLLKSSSVNDKKDEFMTIINDEYFKATLTSLGLAVMNFLPIRYKLYYMLIKCHLPEVAYVLM